MDVGFHFLQCDFFLGPGSFSGCELAYLRAQPVVLLLHFVVPVLFVAVVEGGWSVLSHSTYTMALTAFSFERVQSIDSISFGDDGSRMKMDG